MSERENVGHKFGSAEDSFHWIMAEFERISPAVLEDVFDS
jgi:hypothetical protein